MAESEAFREWFNNNKDELFFTTQDKDIASKAWNAALRWAVEEVEDVELGPHAHIEISEAIEEGLNE